MELKSTNKVIMSLEGEKGSYELALPLGSSLEEAVKISSSFTHALNQSWEAYKAKQEENKEESDGVEE